MKPIKTHVSIVCLNCGCHVGFPRGVFCCLPLGTHLFKCVIVSTQQIVPDSTVLNNYGLRSNVLYLPPRKPSLSVEKPDLNPE